MKKDDTVFIKGRFGSRGFGFIKNRLKGRYRDYYNVHMDGMGEATEHRDNLIRVPAWLRGLDVSLCWTIFFLIIITFGVALLSTIL